MKKQPTKTSRIKKFARKEAREISLFAARKETFPQLVKHSAQFLKDAFIPHEGNNHHPKALRPRFLTFVALFAVLIKITLIAGLFLMYPSQAQMSDEIRKQIQDLLNQDRLNNHLPELKTNRALELAADAKAENMIYNNYFAHVSPDGLSPWHFIKRTEYPYIFVGENLAMNFATAESVHKALMNSPSHRKNILNEKYNDVGIAVLSGEINGSQTLILVEMFGAAQAPTLPSTLAQTEDQPSIKSALQQPVQKAAIAQAERSDEEQKQKTQQMKEVQENEPAQQETAEGKQQNTAANEEKKELVAATPDVLAKTNLLQIEESFLETHENIVKHVAVGDVSLASRTTRYSHYFFAFLMIFLFIALALNVFIRIRIQHKHAIAHALLTLALMGGLLTIRVHFLETLSDLIAII